MADETYKGEFYCVSTGCGQRPSRRPGLCQGGTGGQPGPRAQAGESCPSGRGCGTGSLP